MTTKRHRLPLEYFYSLTAICVTFFGILTNLPIKWMLLDDGQTITFIQSINRALLNFDFGKLVHLFFEPTGRFRPVYWLSNYLPWLVGGENAIVFRLGHMLVYFAIGLVIYKTVIKISASRSAALFSALLFLTLQLNIENWLRLGPQEPLVTLFCLSALYLLLFSSKIHFGIIFFCLALLTKETTFLLIPGFWLIYIFRNSLGISNTITKPVVSVLSVASLLLFLVALANRSNYSIGYSLDLNGIIANLQSYANLLIDDTLFITVICGGFFVIDIIKKIRFYKSDKTLLYSVLFLVFAGLFLVAVLPWKFTLARYLMPCLACYMIFIGIQVAQITSNREMGKLMTGLVNCSIIGIFVYSLLTNSLRYVFSATMLEDETRILADCSYYLATNAPPGEIIYVNLKNTENNSEYVYEILLHQKVFWQRDDLEVTYLPEGLISDGIIMDINMGEKLHDSGDFRDKYAYKHAYELADIGRVPVFTTQPGLVKEIVKKVWAIFVTNKLLSLDGIYTEYKYQSRCGLYFF